MFLDLSFNSFPAETVPGHLIEARKTRTVTTSVVLPRHEDDDEEIVIEMVSCDAQRRDASALINRMYAERGYGSHHELSAKIGQTTFSVSAGGCTIGTLTLTVDSEAGLATDVTFRDELNTYRRVPGASICELTRFAFDATNPSMRLLASLFHIIFIYGQRKYGCTDLFIEVAQRHRRFYETMLGFERVCPLKINDNVGVPSQLMRLKVDKIRSYIEASAGSDGVSRRSLYPLFFPKCEEDRIYKELASSIGETDPARSRGYPDPEILGAVPNYCETKSRHEAVPARG